MAEVEIRPITTLDEMRKIVHVQKTIWNSDDLETLPVHSLHAIQYNGGALFGAYDGDRLVGFVVGILGTVPSDGRRDQIAAARLKMYSVIAGVLPEYQSQGVGFRLKLAQRDFCLNIGIRLITWTYDPLESRNGRFNIGKLGCVCRRYLRHFHGEMGGLNAGLPTDRFEVEWWVTSSRVEGRVVKRRRALSLDALIGGGSVLVNEATFNQKGLPVPPSNYVSRPGSLILVEIPADFQALKRQDMELARQWRKHSRHLFETLFQDGYLVTDFVFHKDQQGQPRSFYLLTHQDA